MDRIKCITFNKKAQDDLPEHIKTKMKADREKDKREQLGNGLNIADVSGQSEQLFCPDCKSKARLQNGFIWCENEDCGGIYRAK